MNLPSVLAVVGPTAVGKTAIAEALALALRGELVSADSMQVYRGMDIGTAKTPASARQVAHHCVDIAEPGSAYSAALFQRDARAAIADIRARGLLPIVVGGTGLYVRAALDDFDFPAGDLHAPARLRLERRVATEGRDALYAELQTRDPASAALIHPNNVRRVIRALELLDEQTSYAARSADFGVRRAVYPGTRFIGLTADRKALYERIDRRVDEMIADGLPGEVRRLLEAGYRDALTAAQAIGYKELVPVVEGTAALEDAVRAIKQATRRYAKRQITWFRADPRVEWLDVTDLSTAEAAARALRLVESSEHPA